MKLCEQMRGGAAPPVVDENTKDVLRMVFSPRGSYVQELLVDELVRPPSVLSV